MIETVTYTGLLNLTSPASNRVFQRDIRIGNPVGNWTASYGKGWGTVTFGINPSTGAALIEYRVRDAENAAQRPLLDWASCGTNIPAGSNTLAVVLPARAGWSFVDIRANGDDSSIVTTNLVGVGEVIAATGQSLATDFWTTLATGDTATLSNCGVAPSPYGVCLAAWDGAPAPSPGTPWRVPSNTSEYRSTFCGEFTRLAVTGCGVNCGLVGYAWSGEPIASWAADDSGPKNVWALLTSTLDAGVGQGGKIGTFIWAQGHNDARYPQIGIDGDELTSDRYVHTLGQVLDALAARYSGFTFARILSSIPAIGANWITAVPKFSPFFIEQIRAAHLRYSRSDPLVLGHVDGLDVALWSDQTHPSQTGNVTYARHFYRALMRVPGFGLNSSGDCGPTLAGTAIRPHGGRQIGLRITQNGGTTLTCSGGAAGAATQFQVFKSGSTAIADQYLIASADLSDPNVIVLGLMATPADTQALDVWYRLPPDNDLALLPSNQIYDDNILESGLDGLTIGRQLAMVATPITVPAPSWHELVLVRPGASMFIANASIAYAL